MELLEGLPDVLLPGGAIGAGVWLFYRLFVRSDRREAEAFDRVVEQRDHYRSRAEESERLLADALGDLAAYRQQCGPLEWDVVRAERDRLRADRKRRQ